MASSFACNRTKGSGRPKTETREIAPFTQVEVSNAFVIEITAGSEKQGVAVTADDNVLPLIVTEVEGSRLFVRMKSNVSVDHAPTVSITVAKLEAFDASGAADATLRGLSSKTFRLTTSGAGRIEAAGHVDSLTIDSSGAATLKLASLEARVIELKMSGASLVALQASESIKGSASGAGNITYSGTNDVKIATSGAVRVSRK